jgi:AAA+ superfamily predicted ATPase
MARVNQLSKLFRSIASGDRSAALELAELIAEDEAQRGHHAAARTLRGSLNTNGGLRPVNGFAIHPTDSGVTSMLIQEPEGPQLSEVMLRQPARQQLNELIVEWQQQLVLQARGVLRRRTVLLDGPPGCGKTLTARSLGCETSLPVYTARLSSIVGSYLGQTGANLKKLFTYAQNTPCILLLDEFDALGRARGRADDVGELDRVVISLLQELDHTDAAGFIVAATNMGDALDPALWRRFDLSITLPKPTKAELRRFARQNAKELGVRLSKSLQQRLDKLRTYAAVEKHLEDARRRHLLSSLGRK